jgi:hypothetical protein
MMQQDFDGLIIERSKAYIAAVQGRSTQQGAIIPSTA